MTTSTTSKNNRARRALRSLAVLGFWLLVWAILARIVGKAILLPSPVQVLDAFAVMVRESSFWLAVASSLLRILLGYAAGCALGVLLAALCFRFSAADALLSPLLGIIRAVPVASFIVLALVWLGRSVIPSFISFLMVLPILAGNVRAGLDAASPELLEVAALYRFGTWKKLRYLYAPSAFPHFLSASRTALGLAWKAGIAAEVLCSLSHSIGGGINNSKLYLETDRLFAWTLTVILISMCIEKLLFFRTNSAASPRKRRRKERAS